MFYLKGEEHMRQMRQLIKEKCPRSYKIISVSSDLAFNLGYWGACTVALYIYVLRYSVRGCSDSIDK